MIYAKIKTDQAKAEEIKDFYNAEEITDPKRPYEYFLVRKDGVEIHAYKNRKEVYTILFSGDEKAIDEAKFFSENVTINEVSNNNEEKNKSYTECWDDLSSQIGSDEVGVGDFFGPLIVTACYIESTDIPFLEKLKVNDSKKISDEHILEIGPSLKRKIKNHVVLISPEKLSSLSQHNWSTHKIMAHLHNFAQRCLIDKYHLSDDLIVYIDQFETEENYKRALGDEIISNPLYFRTSGETYYPSVAASSVIARYSFLKEWMKMEERLGQNIPKGASSLVDTTYNILKKKFPQTTLDKYVKKYFRNYRD